jgi:hypothetical protein
LRAGSAKHADEHDRRHDAGEDRSFCRHGRFQ